MLNFEQNSNTFIMITSKYIKSFFYTLLCCVITSSIYAQTLTAGKQNKPTTTYNTSTFIIPAKPINYSEVQKNLIYPSVCRSLGIEGKVFVKILVDKNGKVIKHELLNELHPAINTSCSNQVNSLEFEPAKNLDGIPVENWVVIPFHFKLDI